MEIQFLLIFTTCVVNLKFTFVQAHDQVAEQAVSKKLNDDREIQRSFQNLLNSIAQKNTKKSVIYHEILKQETAREQQAFDAMKEDLQVAQNRNAYRKKNFYEKSNINENFIAAKRETKEKNGGSVLMVCSENYAVSPMAEAIFKDLAKKKGVSADWRCDSAGIDARCSDYINEKASAKLQEHGIEPENRTCRQLTEDDFYKYDYALAMDRENLRDMRGIALVDSTTKLELLPSYDPEGKQTIRSPNFLWANEEAYEEPFQIMNRSCNAFLDKHSKSKTT